MKITYQAFVKKLLLFTIILAIAGYGIYQILPTEFTSPVIIYLYLFFFSVTLIVHYLLLKIAQKRANSFINYFMLLTFGKLLFFLTIILIYALLFRTDAKVFIITFFILYVCFTSFEVVMSLKGAQSGSLKKQ
jgi:hypothetical protein